MKLADYKRTKGLTLTDLARQLGFGISTVHGWLSGERMPGMAAIPQIIKETDGLVTVADLRPELADSRRSRPVQKEVA